MKRRVEALGLARGQERRRNLAPDFPHLLFAAETMRYLPEASVEMLQFMESEGRRWGESQLSFRKRHLHRSDLQLQGPPGQCDSEMMQHFVAESL